MLYNILLGGVTHRHFYYTSSLLLIFKIDIILSDDANAKLDVYDTVRLLNKRKISKVAHIIFQR